MTAAGEYGAMPQAARNWAETGALLCEVLAAELEQHRTGSPHPAPASTTAMSLPSAEQLQSAPSLLKAQCGQGISNGRPEAHGASAPRETERIRASADMPENRDTDKADVSMLLSAERHPTSNQAPCLGNQARVADVERAEAHIKWPEVAPAGVTAQSTGHDHVPEPPAEFASVLCATWHALAPEVSWPDSVPAQTQALEQKQRPSMPSSLPSQQGSSQCDRAELGAPAGKKLKVAQSQAGTEADAGSAAAGEAAAAGSARDRYAAVNQQHVGPQGLGLDFRLFGEPAGFRSCSTPPSSKPQLRAALESELAVSGLSLLISCCMHGTPCAVFL